MSRSSSSRFAAILAAAITALVAPTAAHAQSCAKGSWSPTGHVPCTLASPGYYVATTGATSQTPASLGYFVSGAGAITQVKAAKGWYVPTVHAIAPIQASPGYYVPTPGSNMQFPAPVGTYVPGAGAFAVINAQPGYFVANPGSTSQTPAPLGFYAPNAKMTAPIPAASGYFVGALASTTQTHCPALTNSYGQAPACRFTGKTAPQTPGSIGPQFESSIPAGTAFDIGHLAVGQTMTLNEWIMNASTDLTSLGVFSNFSVLKLTALNVRGSSFNGTPNVGVTVSGLPGSFMLYEGGVQPFDIAITGQQLGAFDATFTFQTDQTANFRDPGETFSFQVTGNVTPEPSTLSFLGIGAAGMLLVGYRRRRTMAALPVARDESN